MEVEEAFLGHCFRLRLDCFVLAFEYARAVAPNGVFGCGESYEPSCDTLPQPLTLIACYRTVAIQCPVEGVRHQVEDVYNLNPAFAELHELLDLRVFARYLLLSHF
jgi:hypothetical protein